MKIYEFDSHQIYVKIQQDRHEKTRDRTVNRRETRLNDIGRIKQFISRHSLERIEKPRVLCVGCRHFSEIQDFIDAGFDTEGIDILSDPSGRIIHRDMHEIKDVYTKGSFDIVYMSHSLEHSRDPKKVLEGVFHVAPKFGAYVVLPVQDEPDEKDPTVFNFMSSKTHSNGDGWFEEDVMDELFNNVFDGKISTTVEGMIFREACGAEEMAFFMYPANNTSHIQEVD